MESKVELKQTVSAPPALPETLLIERSLAGDKSSFELLVKRHFSSLYRVLYAMLKSQSDTEAALQETWLQVKHKLPSFRGEGSFSTWLHRITVNAGLMRLRKQSKGLPLLSEDGLPQLEDGRFVCQVSGEEFLRKTENQMETQELRQKAQSILEQMPRRYGLILALREVEEWSYKEISQVLGLSVPAVKSILHRARLFMLGQLSA